MNVYLISSPNSLRLSRLSQSQIEAGTNASPIECTFVNPKAVKSKAPRKKRVKKQLVEMSGDGKDGKDVVDGPWEDEEAAQAEAEAEAEVEEEDDEQSEGMSSGFGEEEDGWRVILGKPNQAQSTKNGAKRKAVGSGDR